MKARVTWIDNFTFVAQSSSGHAVVMDAATTPGGPTVAPSPMEYLLMGTGGCAAIDIVMILKKGRHDIRGCECRLDSERAATDPKVFTTINLHFVVTGKGLKPETVKRAIELSTEKYCSASIMLGKAVLITHSFEIVTTE